MLGAEPSKGTVFRTEMVTGLLEWWTHDLTVPQRES
jgi:hypothetical protein